MKKTKSNYEKYLNEIGTPDDDKKSNGGIVPDYCNYGVWVRKKRPYCVRGWLSRLEK